MQPPESASVLSRAMLQGCEETGWQCPNRCKEADVLHLPGNPEESYFDNFRVWASPSLCPQISQRGAYYVSEFRFLQLTHFLGKTNIEYSIKKDVIDQ